MNAIRFTTNAIRTVPAVRWWRYGDRAVMSLIHLEDENAHDTMGRTLCGKTFPKHDRVPGPHHEIVGTDGTVSDEDRYCRSCLLAIGGAA